MDKDREKRAILGVMSRCVDPMIHGTDDMLCPPMQEGGQSHACYSMLHCTTAILPPMHIV